LLLFALAQAELWGPSDAASLAAFLSNHKREHPHTWSQKQHCCNCHAGVEQVGIQASPADVSRLQHRAYQVSGSSSRCQDDRPARQDVHWPDTQCTCNLCSMVAFSTGVTSLKVTSAHGGYLGSNERPGLCRDPLSQQPQAPSTSRRTQQQPALAGQKVSGLGAAVGRLLECMPPG
jgi:hypothetical protein